MDDLLDLARVHRSRAAVLVVVMLFLGLILLAAWIQRVRISGGKGFATPDDVPLSILVPAFVTSELKTAFLIGFLIFIPFVIIDLVVASVLMSMGMMMLSPVLISLPFKLMLFVLVDGWTLVMGTLAASFYS